MNNPFKFGGKENPPPPGKDKYIATGFALNWKKNDDNINHFATEVTASSKDEAEDKVMEIKKYNPFGKNGVFVGQIIKSDDPELESNVKDLLSP